GGFASPENERTFISATGEPRRRAGTEPPRAADPAAAGRRHARRAGGARAVDLAADRAHARQERHDQARRGHADRGGGHRAAARADPLDPADDCGRLPTRAAPARATILPLTGSPRRDAAWPRRPRPAPRSTPRS